MEVQFASRFALNQDCQRVASATVLVVGRSKCFGWPSRLLNTYQELIRCSNHSPLACSTCETSVTQYA